MQATDDSALLREYAGNNSEEAFAILVVRHINLVYSVALRQAGNPHHAEEITQAVFIILAKKAGKLRHDKALPSWLFQTTQLTTNNFVRSEIRRQHREQEAFMQSTANESGNEIWPSVAPLLDTAVAGLNEKDRRAILLRFYEGRDLSEVGAALGASEDAAKKRVNRAVEKLRGFFKRRGVVLTAAVLTATISANSVQAAPVALAKSVTAVAIAKGATASGSTLTLIKGALKLMAWTKAKMAIITGAAVLLAVGGGTVIYEVQRPAPGAPAELKARWMVGKKYNLHGEINQSAKTKSPDRPQPVEHGFKLTQDLSISALKELPDGGRQLELEFVNVAMDESQAGHNVLSFDSTQSRAVNKQNPLTILGALFGMRLDYFTDADGKVQTVEGMNQLTDHIAAVGTPQQRQLFNGLFGGDNLKYYLSWGDWLPNGMIKVGESWSAKNDVADSTGILTVSMKFTFKNWEQHGDHQCARILGTGNLAYKSVSAASGELVRIEKGNLAEEFWFDPGPGMIADGNETEDTIFKITTRTQTSTEETHTKLHWTMVEAP
jgi:RNA polymerase sigma factor (sigma-70 family)